MCARYPDVGWFWFRYVCIVPIVILWSLFASRVLGGDFEAAHFWCWVGWSFAEYLGYRRWYLKKMLSIHVRELERLKKKTEELIMKHQSHHTS